MRRRGEYGLLSKYMDANAKIKYEKKKKYQNGGSLIWNGKGTEENE